MKKTLLAVCFAAWLFPGSSAWTAHAEGREKPNFLVIMADDLGYGDLSIYGAPDIRTPNIDSLMRSGVRFTDFTANSCVCSPSRAAFITGRFSDTAGVPAVMYSDSRGFLDPQAVALPEVLRDHGYRTSLIGKWHLGEKSPNTPNDRGFEEFRGMIKGGTDYWTHKMRGSVNMYHNDQKLTDTAGVHVTELFTEWAIKDLEVTREDRRPFFLFLSTTRRIVLFSAFSGG